MVWHFILPPLWGADELATFNAYLQQWWAFGDLAGNVPVSDALYKGQSTLLTTAIGLLPIGGPLPVRLLVTLLNEIVDVFDSPAVSEVLAPVFTLRCASPFTRDVGRFYLPGLRADYASSDDEAQLDPAARDNLLATFNGLGDDMLATFGRHQLPLWVVWLRRRQVGGPLAMPVVAPVRQVVYIQPAMRVQRLRQKGQRRRDVVPD